MADDKVLFIINRAVSFLHSLGLTYYLAYLDTECASAQQEFAIKFIGSLSFDCHPPLLETQQNYYEWN